MFAVHDYSSQLEHKSKSTDEKILKSSKDLDDSESSDSDSSEESEEEQIASLGESDPDDTLCSSLLNSLSVHEKRSCRAVQFSKHGNHLITAGADGFLVCMDVETQNLLIGGSNNNKDKVQGKNPNHILSKHGGHGEYAINCLQILPESAHCGHELIVTGDDEGNVKLWDIVRFF